MSFGGLKKPSLEGNVAEKNLHFGVRVRGQCLAIPGRGRFEITSLTGQGTQLHQRDSEEARSSFGEVDGPTQRFFRLLVLTKHSLPHRQPNKDHRVGSETPQVLFAQRDIQRRQVLVGGRDDPIAALSL